MWLVVSMTCPVAVAASDSPKAAGATVSPSPECRLSFMDSALVKARGLDNRRLEVVWRLGKRVVKTEMRVTCTTESMNQALTDAGFSKPEGQWQLAAGSGSTKADSVETPSWNGVAATYFQGNVCRAVVGQASSGAFRFTLDFCVSESEYKRFHEQFEHVERCINVDAAAR